jgi:opacity protein-like surface antigen
VRTNVQTLIKVVCLGTVMALGQTPGLVSAEWYADIYGGGAFTTKHNTESALPGFTVTAHDVRFDTSGTVGGRTGVWFDQLPWLGVGVDVFHFQPTIGGGQTLEITAPGLNGTTTIQTINVSVLGLGFDVLRLRLPLLQGEDFPHGRLQPYVTAGPALFWTRAEDTTNLAPPANQSNTDMSLGVKVGAGTSYQLTPLIGLFGEYRFTYFEAQHECAGPVQLSETFKTHHVIGWLSFRF